MRDMHITSMGQDVYLTKRGATELESLNGYFLRMAEKVAFDARYNRALYALRRSGSHNRKFGLFTSGSFGRSCVKHEVPHDCEPACRWFDSVPGHHFQVFDLQRVLAIPVDCPWASMVHPRTIGKWVGRAGRLGHGS